MAMKSKLRLNQMAEGLALLDGAALADVASGTVTTYLSGIGAGEKSGTLEETLENMYVGFAKRFGTTTVNGKNAIYGGVNTAGVIASFSANDAANSVITNVASDKKTTLSHVTGNFDGKIEISDDTANTSGTIDISANKAQILMTKDASIEMYKDNTSASANFIKLSSAFDANWGESTITLQDGKKFLQQDLTSGAGYSYIIHASAAASHTDIYGTANVSGDYRQFVGSKIVDEKSVKKDSSLINGDVQHVFSDDKASDHSYKVQAGGILGTHGVVKTAFTTSNNVDGIWMEAAAQKVNGDQYWSLGVSKKSTNPGTAADAKYAILDMGLASGILMRSQAKIEIAADDAGMDLVAKSDMKVSSDALLDASGKAIHLKTVGGTARANPSTLTNYGTGNLIPATSGLSSDAEEIWLGDVHAGGSGNWSPGSLGLPLSVATSEWDDFEQVFGEVSLLNALVQAGTGGTVDAGTHIVKMDATVAKDTALLVSGTTESDNARFSMFVFNSKDTGVQVDEKNTTVIDGFPCSGLDANEILAAVKVYVNGQLLAGNVAHATAPSAGNYDYHILDKDGASAFAAGQPFSLKFAFQLEASDMIQVVIG